MKDCYKVKPVGIIHSGPATREQVIESAVREECGEIFREHEAGFRDLDGFSHIVVIHWMHHPSFRSPTVRPLRHPERLRGVFATLHPDRPNPLGITVVRLMSHRCNVLDVQGLDMFDGTPVLDLKPSTKSLQKDRMAAGWFSKSDNKPREE